MKENEIIKIYGTEYKEMTLKLLKAVSLTELLKKKCREKGLGKDINIAIKPNLVTCSPASFGATTHPEIVAGLIEYLQSEGYENISIMEGSWIGDKTAEAFEYCGYNEIRDKYGVILVDTQKEASFLSTQTEIGLNICNCVKEADFLINVPVLKGHCQTKITCALKNMKGLIPNSEKRRFHTMGLHTPIAHLNANIKQDFILVDHICGDPDFEEGGSPLVKNCIMAALDPVLLDTYVCKIFDLTPADVPYVQISSQLKIGSSNIDTLIIKELIGADCKIIDPKEDLHREQLPDVHKILNVNYAVSDIDSCSACYAELMDALCRLKTEGLLDNLKEKICIGQGHREKKGMYGVGNCTKEFTHTIPGCPPTAEEIYRTIKNDWINY